MLLSRHERTKVTERIHAHHHAVQFYGDERELFKTIGTFLSEGLVAGQPAVVIATPPHSAAIQDALGAHLIDVARARHLGDLVMLDAEETLGRSEEHTSELQSQSKLVC